MAINRNLTDIEKKLKDFNSKAEKIEYLSGLLFIREKALAEFNRDDLENLERLKIKTAKDYEKYLNEFDNDRLVYLYPPTLADTGKRLGLENIELMVKRIRLERDYKNLIQEIQIFKFWISRVKDELIVRKIPNKENLIESIEHFLEWSNPFKFLYSTVIAICEAIEPVYPNVDPLKYFKYFLERIDYTKVDKSEIILSPDEVSSYFENLHWGFNEILRVDVNGAIGAFQAKIPQLNHEQAIEVQRKIIGIIGRLKTGYKDGLSGKSLTKLYMEQREVIKKDSVYVDYIKLILQFQDSLLTELLGKYQIINESLKEILPLLPTSSNKEIKHVSESSLSTIKSEVKINSVKPTFKAEIIDQVFNLLKSYFPEQDAELKQCLNTGLAPSKLLFNGSGKTLLDFFKQLIKGQFLIITTQIEFEKWLSESFEFVFRGKRTAITEKYASTIISSNDRAAKGNRLIDVIREGEAFKIKPLEIQNRQQN